MAARKVARKVARKAAARTDYASHAIQLALKRLVRFYRIDKDPDRPRVSAEERLAEVLPISRHQIRKLLKRGLGPKQVQEQAWVSKLLEALYRECEIIRASPVKRAKEQLLTAEELPKKESLRTGRDLSLWGARFRKAGLRSLVRDANDQVKKSNGVSETQPSAYPHIAACLGWENVAELKNWGYAKRVPREHVGRVLAAFSAREYAVGRGAREITAGLIAEARKGAGPGREAFVPGDRFRRGQESAHVEGISPFRNREGVTYGDGRIGYHWGKGINQFLSYPVIDRIHRFCSGVKLPLGFRRRMRRYMCVAVCAEWHRPDLEPPPETKSDRGLRMYFPDSDEQTQSDAKTFTHTQGRSSGWFSSLQTAADQLRNVLVERSELDAVTFIQGAVVYSWRPETEREKGAREAQARDRAQADTDARLEALRERASRRQVLANYRAMPESMTHQMSFAAFEELYRRQEKLRQDLLGSPAVMTTTRRRERLRRLRRKKR